MNIAALVLAVRATNSPISGAMYAWLSTTLVMPLMASIAYFVFPDAAAVMRGGLSAVIITVIGCGWAVGYNAVALLLFGAPSVVLSLIAIACLQPILRRYRAVIPGDGSRCIECGYLLQGCSGLRCPECGNAFKRPDAEFRE